MEPTHQALVGATALIIQVEAELKAAATLPTARRVELGAIQRMAYRQYLDAIADILTKTNSLPHRAIQPLVTLSDKIAALDGTAETPTLFAVPGGSSKPYNRLRAEGHAVGCVIYLMEAVGDKVMFSCKAVASMFGHVGHAGRIKERLHSPSQQNSKTLSKTTLHQWYSELGPSITRVDDEACLRQAAKAEAFNCLAGSEAAVPTKHLPLDEYRQKLAERIITIATWTRMGDGPSGWRRVLKGDSE